MGLRAGRRKPVMPLRVVENFPGGREQDEAAEDQNITQDVKRAEVRIRASSERCFE